jgi:aminopeptidase N
MKTPLNILFLFSLLFASLSFSQDKFHVAEWPRSLEKSFSGPFSPNPIDVLSYDINLDINPDTRKITGITRLQIMPLDINSEKFYLNLINLEVDSIFVGNIKTAFERTSTHIILPLPVVDYSFTTTVYYHGTPGNDGSGGFFWGTDIIWTTGEALNSYPPSTLRYWVPSNDQPADKALLDIKVTVPQPLQVISGGELFSQTNNPNNTTTWHWRERNPIATYLLAISISEFKNFGEKYVSTLGDTIPLAYYVIPTLLDNAKEDWKDTGKMMAFFEDVFSPYPFNKYGMVSVPMRGAMEHQSMTSYGTGLITGDHRYDYIVAHELAHQWWGDYVTIGDWRDLWLNEGFATYSEALYFESIGDESTLPDYMARLKDIYLTEVTRLGHFPIYDPDYLWGGTIYQKGAWVLHMLRWNLGDSLFFETLREYARRFAYSNAVTENFQTVVEDISGNDFDWFFDQWIFDPGFPELKVGWDYTRTTPQQFDITLSIQQTQNVETLFQIPIEVLVKTAGEEILDTLVLANKSSQFSLVSFEKPTEIIIDPNNWLLKKVEIVSQPLPLGFLPDDFNLAQNYPNPFAPGTLGNETKIILQIGMKNAPFDVTVTIFNLLGQRVKKLVNKQMLGGLYTLSWDGRNEQGNPAPNGIYLYQLRVGNKTKTKRLSLLRD